MIWSRELNWLGRKLLEADLEWAAAEFAHGRLLDVGCGTKPYAFLFAPFVSEHVGADFRDGLHGDDAVDVYVVDENLPVEDASFDTLLSTQVLEHMRRPGTALSEAFRVLKPGGHLILSAPHIWDVHESPNDYWRFTCYGLKLLLEDAGFEVVAIRPEGGYWVTAAQRFSYFIYRHSRGGRLRRIVAPLLWTAVQRIGLALDNRWPYPEETENYFSVSVRRVEETASAQTADDESDESLTDWRPVE